MQRPIMLALAAATAAAVIAGCSSMATTPAAPMKAAALQDGELPLPANYKSWPKFLSAVQRPDVKQVREIYVNATGYNAKAGQPFSHGTTFVMENWAVQVDAAGNPVTGADGKLVKDKLLRVFVMSKGEGFGSAAIPELRNGDWAYAAYDAAGAKTADPLGACRACHLPLANKDFVHRYDEFFAARSKGAY